MRQRKGMKFSHKTVSTTLLKLTYSFHHRKCISYNITAQAKFKSWQVLTGVLSVDSLLLKNSSVLTVRQRKWIVYCLQIQAALHWLSYISIWSLKILNVNNLKIHLSNLHVHEKQTSNSLIHLIKHEPRKKS